MTNSNNSVSGKNSDPSNIQCAREKFSSNDQAYISRLEARLSSESNQLEELHMEAAIDAELEDLKEKVGHNVEPTNPNSVANCLSPFVPTSAGKIQAFVEWVGLTSDDVLLDIGCGDGRVCIAAAKLCGCRTIGIDVSPLCIDRANAIAKEEKLEGLCTFYKADATIDPEELLAGGEQDASTMMKTLSSALKQVTVIFLYTYPTLLIKLVPLLSNLLKDYLARSVVTLTYHIPNQHVVTLKDSHSEWDFQWYTALQNGNLLSS